MSLPLVVPPYVLALSVILVAGPRGLAEQAFSATLPSPFGLWGSAFVLTMATYPYVFLLTSAALRSLDPSREEAAKVSGRTALSRFLLVIFPAIKPAVAGGALLAALYCISDFGAVAVMRYNTLTVAVYEQITARYDRAGAAVLSLVLIALGATVTLTQSRLVGDRHAEEGVRRGDANVQSRGSGFPAAGGLAFVGLVALGLPLFSLAWWIFTQPGVRVEDGTGRFALNAVVTSAIAATIIVLVAIPPALMAEGSRLRRLMVRGMILIGYSVPGVVAGLATAMILLQLPLPLYATAGAVVAAYLVRFLPQGLLAAEAGGGAPGPLTEAGLTLGRRPLAVAARVTLPLMRPHLIAGWALIFLSCLKELPATLLLRPPGFETLATRIWVHSSQGSFGRAAVPALILILLAAPPLALLLRRGNIVLGNPTKSS